MKASVYIATSLDGFIARKDGSLDWLPAFGANGEDYGYHTFMDTIDALVMGRNTFEMVLSFGVAWPYTRPVVVLSSSAVDIPESLAGNVEWISGSMPDIVQALIQRGFNHVYLDGGKTIQSFMEIGMVDQIIITIIPVLLGEGIPLFGPVSADISLNLLESQSWPSGLVQVRYEVVK